MTETNAKFPKMVYAYFDLMGGLHLGHEWVGKIPDHVQQYVPAQAVADLEARLKRAETALKFYAQYPEDAGMWQEFVALEDNGEVAQTYFEEKK